MRASQSIQGAIKAKDWDLAEKIATEDMRGAQAYNWLVEINKLRDAGNGMAGSVTRSDFAGGSFPDNSDHR